MRSLQLGHSTAEGLLRVYESNLTRLGSYFGPYMVILQGSFRKLGVPYFGGYYIRVPYFRKLPQHPQNPEL